MNLEEKFRIRWRRWLGNKTAKNGPYWTTLLDSKWTCWCYRVCGNHRIDNRMEWTRESVKDMYRLCIDIATMEELRELDNIYAWDKMEGES